MEVVSGVYEHLGERFLQFPSRVRLGCPKPYNSRHLKAPEHFQNSLPPSTAGDASFFRSGSGEGLSEPVMQFPAVLGVYLKERKEVVSGVYEHLGEHPTPYSHRPWNSIIKDMYKWTERVRMAGTEKKKAYTTTTERKSFGELFWPQRKTFQAGGGYKNPIKTRKAISTTEIFPLWTPFFSAKKSSALEQGGVCFLFPSGTYLEFTSYTLSLGQKRDSGHSS